MKPIKLLVVLVILLSTTKSIAQCTINMPSNVIVNGGGLLNQFIYIGYGENETSLGTGCTYFVDNGGHLTCMGDSCTVYAASHSSIEMFPGSVAHLYTDFFVTITGINNVTGNHCSPMIFDFSYFGSSLDSFYLYYQKSCDGPTITTTTLSYSTGMSIVTDFGDGNVITSPVQSGNNARGFASVTHPYLTPGHYFIKQILYHGSDAVDSLALNYFHEYCSTMQINFFNDANSNCSFDQGDVIVPYPALIEVDSNGAPVDTISATSGITYTAHGVTGDVYSFKIIDMPASISPTCPVTGIINDTFQVGNNNPKYMGFECMYGNTSDLSVLVHGTKVGSHAFETYIVPQNQYCAQNGTLTMNYGTDYTAFYSVPPPAFQSPGTATWNINNLSVLSPQQIYVHLDGAQKAFMDTLTTIYTITPLTNDINSANNTLVVIDTADGSFDPNAIYVKPEGCVTPGANLEYTITFENLGNSPAENIYILDTLPIGLDPGSMRLKYASHSMYIEKIYWHQQVILKFNFPEIMLPDSSDHVGRHGGLVYTINTTSNFQIGSSFGHRAGIYFDFNDPVMTNTAYTGSCWPVSGSTTNAKLGNISLYPNPATDELTIKTEKQYSSYTISNSIGQVLLQRSWDSKEAKVNIKSLAPGMYYVGLEGEHGMEVKKFVKM